MRRNDSRPLSWSASMIPRSRSSTRRAGATGPRGASSPGWRRTGDPRSCAMRGIRTTLLRIPSISLTYRRRDARSSRQSSIEEATVARTPLLRAFQRLADEHRTQPTASASRLRSSGGSAGEHAYDARRVPEARRRRRRAATVAGSRTSRAACAANGSHGGPRIAIVGGGIAGLSAALKLADKGVTSTCTSRRRIGSADGCTPTDEWQAIGTTARAEFCGELIDSGHTTIRGLAKRFDLGSTTCSPASRAARPIRTPSSARTTPSTKPMPTSGVQPDRLRPGECGGLSDDVEFVDAHRPDARPHVGLRLDRRLRPRRAPLPNGPRCSMQRMPRSTARTRPASRRSTCSTCWPSSRPRTASRSSASRTRSSISPAGTATSRGDRIAARQRAARLVAAAISTNRNGIVALTFSTGDRSRTVIADHAILALPFAVLRNLDYSGAGFDAAQADGDHPARRRPQHEAAAPVREPVLEPRGAGEVDRRHLHRLSASRTPGT